MAKTLQNNKSFGHVAVAQTVAHSESEMPKYVERRGNVYWFRRRAPAALPPGTPLLLDDRSVSVNAKSFIRFTLKTSDVKEASRLARKYAHLVDEAAKDVLAGISHPKRKGWTPAKPLEHGEPSPEEIRFAADSMYVSLLAADEKLFEDSTKKAFAQAFGEGESDAEADDEERLSDRHHWSADDLPPLTPQGQAMLIKQWLSTITFALYQYTGKTITAPGPELLPFADAIRRFVVAMEQRRMSSTEVPTPKVPHKGEIWTWQQAFDYYFGQRAHLGQATRDNYWIAWRSLAHSAKGTPAGLTRDTVVSWRDKILTEVGRTTAKNRLTNVGSIWRESHVNGKIPPSVTDPFAGLKVWVDADVDSGRTEFSVEELQKIFSAPPVTTAKAVSVHAGYWLPLLALFHGARLEEITGLEVDDIEDYGESAILYIRINSIRPNLKHGKRSERSVLLHPKLIELGFLEYVKVARVSGLQRLFPSFTRGATFGEAFVEHVKALLKPVQGRLVGLHCFRHCWETARRNGRLDASAAQYITGRKMEHGSANDYGNPAGQKVLLEELSKINYPLKFLPAPKVTAEQLKQQDVIRKQSLRAKKTKPFVNGTR